MNTIVINLFAGSGAGKSTLAAGLFYEMKKRNLNVELVTEFIKNMAWDGIKPGIFDQPFIFGNQVKQESRLYNKVEFLITDSPLLLSPIYEIYYKNYSLTEDSAKQFLNLTSKQNIKHLNLFLNRQVKFNSNGRFETEKQAIEIDNLIKIKLKEWNVPFFIIDTNNVSVVESILDIVNSVREETNNASF